MPIHGCVPLFRQEATGGSAIPVREVLQGASGSCVSPGKPKCPSPRCLPRVAGPCCRTVATQHPVLPRSAAGEASGPAQARVETQRRAACRFRGTVAHAVVAHMPAARIRLVAGRWCTSLFDPGSTTITHRASRRSDFARSRGGGGNEWKGADFPGREVATQWTRIHQMEAIRE